MKQTWALKQLKLYDSPKIIQTNIKTQYKNTSIKEEKILTSNNRSKTKNILRPKTGKTRLLPVLSKSKNSKKNNENEKQQIAKEYLNVLSIEKINFQFEEYGNYPDDNFQPSIFFF